MATADFGQPEASGAHAAAPRWRERLWLHLLLFAITLVATTVMGARLAYSFEHNLPAFGEHDLDALQRIARQPSLIWQGLPFSLTLLSILLAHEFGHYLACVYYGIDASLPYFLPAPTLIGTFGAFIRIRSPIYNRKELFDVGVAGPLAGFLVLLPALAIGLAFSKVIPGIAERGELAFGVPLLERAFQMLIFPGVEAQDIYLHPVGRAAWVGILATALNLLPIGQLDGGHLVYAFAGERSRTLSKIFVAALVPIGIFYSYSWLFWAVFLFLFGLRHPRIYDPERLAGGRRALGVLSLIIFVISFCLVPIRIL